MTSEEIQQAFVSSGKAFMMAQLIRDGREPIMIPSIVNPLTGAIVWARVNQLSPDLAIRNLKQVLRISREKKINGQSLFIRDQLRKVRIVQADLELIWQSAFHSHADRRAAELEEFALIALDRRTDDLIAGDDARAEDSDSDYEP